MIAFKLSDYKYMEEIYDAIDDSTDKSLVFQPYLKTVSSSQSTDNGDEKRAKLKFEK
jgi:hypothetical protein